ncbi:MAG: PD40 domain-containing protein [Deltaproteobacteria bacterium]|nr:PD40 domain-containing protein [Deltaproteobacteria bacterium]
MNRILFRVLAVVSLNACIPLDEGGGGGFGTVTLVNGYAFVRTDTRDVYVADRSDTQTSMALTTDGNNSFPSLSADGKQVVYVHREGALTSLRRAQVQPGAISAAVQDSDGVYAAFRHPVFSPDGSTLAFTFEQGGVSRVGIVGVDGAGFTQVSPAGAFAYGAPAWTPDGLSLVVPAGSTLGNLTQLEQLNVATGTTTVLRASLGNEALSVVNRVVVSPDGTTLAFDGRTAANTQRIFVAPLSGGAVTQATEHTGADALANDSYPCFLSSGLLGFASDAGGASQVYELTLPANRQAGVLAVPSAAEPWFGPYLK